MHNLIHMLCCYQCILDFGKEYAFIDPRDWNIPISDGTGISWGISIRPEKKNYVLHSSWIYLKNWVCWSENYFFKFLSTQKFKILVHFHNSFNRDPILTIYCVLSWPFCLINFLIRVSWWGQHNIFLCPAYIEILALNDLFSVCS